MMRFQSPLVYIFLALFLLMTYRVCRLLLGFVGPSISVIIINKERVLYMDGLKGGSMGGWIWMTGIWMGGWAGGWAFLKVDR